MLEFRACYPEHVRLLQVQPQQRLGWEFYLRNGLENIALKGMAYSGWLGNHCVLAGGLFPLWGRHGQAWLFLSKDVGPHMLALTRFTRGLFAVSPYQRISTTVACDFAAGHRWARLLGMKMECARMTGYDVDGRDHALYAFVR